MLPFLAALLVVSVQDDASLSPASSYDEVVEFELPADGELLLEGRGPTAVVEYEVRFEGSLHVMTQSELDLYVQIDDAQTLSKLDSDDGSRPTMRLDVKGGERLAILVAGEPGVTGPLTLRIHSSLESEETRAAAAKGTEALERARDLLEEGDRARAREQARTRSVPPLGRAANPGHSGRRALPTMTRCPSNTTRCASPSRPLRAG